MEGEEEGKEKEDEEEGEEGEEGGEDREEVGGEDGEEEIVQLLVKVANIDVNIKNKDEDTALHLASQ